MNSLTPRWVRQARAYLVGLRRKDRAAYIDMRKRLAGDWPEVGPIWSRLAAAYEKEGRHPFHTHDDAGTLCAYTLEAFARWAAEERGQVAAIREAERRLIELAEVIDRAVDELAQAVEQSRELQERYGLEVTNPMWTDNLGEALSEVANGFGRWGSEQPVRALLDFERRSFFTPRPGALDVVRAARAVGARPSGHLVPPARDPLGRLVRLRAPEVAADDPLAASALAARAGSGATSEAAQLRQLFAALRNVGGVGMRPGPLEWLTPAELSTLCCVAVGDGRGNRAEGFDVDNVRNALAAFLRAERDATRKS